MRSKNWDTRVAAGDAIDAIARNLSSNVQLKTAKDEAVKGTQCNIRDTFPSLISVVFLLSEKSYIGCNCNFMQLAISCAQLFTTFALLIQYLK